MHSLVHAATCVGHRDKGQVHAVYSTVLVAASHVWCLDGRWCKSLQTQNVCCGPTFNAVLFASNSSAFASIGSMQASWSTDAAKSFCPCLALWPLAGLLFLMWSCRPVECIWDIVVGQDLGCGMTLQLERFQAVSCLLNLQFTFITASSTQGRQQSGCHRNGSSVACASRHYRTPCLSNQPNDTSMQTLEGVTEGAVFVFFVD